MLLVFLCSILMCCSFASARAYLYELYLEEKVIEKYVKYFKRFEALSHICFFSLNILALELSMQFDNGRYFFISFIQIILSILLASIGFLYIFSRMNHSNEKHFSDSETPNILTFNEKRKKALRQKALFSALFGIVSLFVVLGLGITVIHQFWNMTISEICNFQSGNIVILDFLLYVSVNVIELVLILSLEYERKRKQEESAYKAAKDLCRLRSQESLGVSQNDSNMRLNPTSNISGLSVEDKVDYHAAFPETHSFEQAIPIQGSEE
jgi:hypothetical protein